MAPWNWLLCFVATKVPFFKDIAEKRSKEAKFSSVEEWCKSFKSPDELDVDGGLGIKMSACLCLLLVFGTVNLLLKLVCGYTNGVLEFGALGYCIAFVLILIFSAGLWYFLFGPTSIIKTRFVEFSQKDKSFKVWSAVATIFVIIACFFYCFVSLFSER